MYQALRHSRSEFVPIRKLQYHVRHWGEPVPGVPPLVMVHGWMDVSASWQFVVDAFKTHRHVIAPDWRGYGLTQTDTDNYWLPDYLADLDFLLDHYAPEQAVDLVGHSMGGHMVMIYGGARPARVRRLINFEGFGMAPTEPSQAPGRYAKWMDQLKQLARGEMDLKPYPDADGVARRLMRNNPRLTQDKADWLARHWARPNAQGQWEILGDPAHKVTNAILFQAPEVLAAYRCITAPTLVVEAIESHLERWWKGSYTQADFHERLKSVANVRVVQVDDAAHMLHHDQPHAVAKLIEDFIADGTPA